MKKIYILGGGTYSHVRCHLNLDAKANGKTARKLATLFSTELKNNGLENEYEVHTILTQMAMPENNPYKIVTNDDVSALLDTLIADPDTKVIVQNMALCDFSGKIGDIESGKNAKRLRTSEGEVTMTLTVI